MMRTMATITTTPVTLRQWDDVVTVFGRRGNDPTWCWCRRFLDPPDDVEDPSDNRNALRAEIAAALVAPGLIGYFDGVPCGWTRVVPRSTLPGVTTNRA